MTLLKIIDTFAFYGFDTVLLAAATCLIVQLLKVTLFKKRTKKVVTFLPFIVGSLLYAAYAALIHLDFFWVLDNYVAVLEGGLSVGTLATVTYVCYEQFIRGEKDTSATVGVIATLIDGFVPAAEVEKVAEEIAKVIEKDVTGDGAKKTAEILATNGVAGENDIKVLARLIIETLAHMNA